MCGIFGLLRRDRATPDPTAAARMAASLQHRGPDDEGLWQPAGHGVLLGNKRLSIIDIAGGHQPFVSDDGQVAVVQNGEIFNYVELAAELRATGVRLDTSCDTEVILRLYEREGIGFVSRLNGMFAIAIHDAREDAVYLIRDRIGIKPLYVRDDGAEVAFGSEIKAILAADAPGRARAAIDLEAVHHYLSFNYIPAPWTIWQGIRHVMPGTWLKLTRGAAQVQRWWDLSQQQHQQRPFGEWAEEFISILDDATRIQLRADVPWGAFLSGGVDSSTVVALMARHVPQPVRTFCIGFADPRYDESAYAQEAASRFGCNHITQIVELNMLDSWPRVLHYLDQPHGDASFMPTLRVSELAAQHVKVVLTGDGGDELFAGYEKYAEFFAQAGVAELTAGQFQRRYFDSISLFKPPAKLALYQPDVAAQLVGIDSFETVAQPWFSQVDHFDRINQALYLDMQLLLSGNNLVKPDRMGMAVSIEARTPFLDWRMMEFAFRAPGHTKLSADGDKKHWYKKAVAPLIGERLAYRKKQMFTVPVGEWFRAESYPWIKRVLSSERLGTLFRSEAVRAMLEAHRQGAQNHTRELRALAALSLWLEQALP